MCKNMSHASECITQRMCLDPGLAFQSLECITRRSCDIPLGPHDSMLLQDVNLNPGYMNVSKCGSIDSGPPSGPSRPPPSRTPPSRPPPSRPPPSRRYPTFNPASNGKRLVETRYLHATPTIVQTTQDILLPVDVFSIIIMLFMISIVAWVLLGLFLK